MKIYTWQVAIDEKVHTVTYCFSRLKGQMTVTIDEDSFDLPAGFLGLKAKRREIFRLDDEQAVLVVEKNGQPSLLFRGKSVPLGNDGGDKA